MPRLSWQRLHLLFGILGLIAFLFTGQFMDRRLDHLVGMPDGPRSLYRSGHIYILFSALLNLQLGLYVVSSPDRAIRILQQLGSFLLLSALILFVYGFFVETPLAMVERPMTREAIVWSLGGVLLHGTSGLRNRVARPPQATADEDSFSGDPCVMSKRRGAIRQVSKRPAAEGEK